MGRRSHKATVTLESAYPQCRAPGHSQSRRVTPRLPLSTHQRCLTGSSVTADCTSKSSPPKLHLRDLISSDSLSAASYICIQRSTFCPFAPISVDCRAVQVLHGRCIGMATQVLIAHTGQRLDVDTSQFSTYETSSPADKQRRR